MKYYLSEPEVFGNFIKELRESYLINNEKLNSKTFATILGVSPATITKWESGSTYPTLDKIAVISQLFGISIDDLLAAKNDISVEDVNDLSSYLKSTYKASLLNYDDKKKRKILSEFVSVLKALKNKIDSCSNWDDIKYYFCLLGLDFTFNTIAIIYKIDPDFKVFAKDAFEKKIVAYYLPVNSVNLRYLKDIIDNGFVYANKEDLIGDISTIPDYEDENEHYSSFSNFIINDLDGNKAVIKTGKLQKFFVSHDEKEIGETYYRLINHIKEANKYNINLKNSDFVEYGEFYNGLEYLIELLLKEEYKSYLYEILKIGYKRINKFIYKTYIDKTKIKEYDLKTIGMFIKNDVEVDNEILKKCLIYNKR